jgi:hypothetical protein
LRVGIGVSSHQMATASTDAAHARDTSSPAG